MCMLRKEEYIFSFRRHKTLSGGVPATIRLRLRFPVDISSESSSLIIDPFWNKYLNVGE